MIPMVRIQYFNHKKLVADLPKKCCNFAPKKLQLLLKIAAEKQLKLCPTLAVDPFFRVKLVFEGHFEIPRTLGPFDIGTVGLQDFGTAYFPIPPPMFFKFLLHCFTSSFTCPRFTFVFLFPYFLQHVPFENSHFKYLSNRSSLD